MGVGNMRKGMRAARKIDDTILQILAEDQELIPYRKSLNRLTGSVTATLLLQQMIYWASKYENHTFFKFRKPAQRRENEAEENYLNRVKPFRPGDSWCEELGLTPAEFDTARKAIALRKGEVIEEGSLRSCITYWTTRGRITYYQINFVNLAKLTQTL
jgi:hypothetical protein